MKCSPEGEKNSETRATIKKIKYCTTKYIKIIIYLKPKTFTVKEISWVFSAFIVYQKAIGLIAKLNIKKKKKEGDWTSIFFSINLKET